MTRTHDLVAGRRAHGVSRRSTTSGAANLDAPPIRASPGHIRVAGVITYLVGRRNAWTVRAFLDTWGRTVAERFRVVHYEDLGRLDAVSPGVCIFSDIDQLTPGEVERASELRRQLVESGRVRPLNDPARSLRRLELLALLHHQGINHFRAHRVTHLREPLRFPVFLRYEDEHWGSMSPLLHTRRELDRALASACVLHRRPRHLVAVEYCDTRGRDGLHRKYSAFLVDGRAVPRDLIFDRAWLQKDIALVTPETVTEERVYLEANPHEEQLLAVAELAGIDYGRIDYGFVDGELQIWEINTNPVICKTPEEYRADHVGNQAYFAAQMRHTLELLAAEPEDTTPVRLELDSASSTWRQNSVRAVHRLAWDAGAFLGRSSAGRPLVSLLERLVESLHRPLQPFVAFRLRA